MFEVTVEAGFSSGHYLRNYKGKCENPHGHNYKVRVTLAGTELDETVSAVRDFFSRGAPKEAPLSSSLATRN